MLYSDFLSFYVMFFICSRMSSRRSLSISLSCALKLLLAETVSQTSLVSDDLDGFERYRYLVGCPSLEPDAFLVIGPGVWSWGWKIILLIPCHGKDTKCPHDL